jgi:hypothetical protein
MYECRTTWRPFPFLYLALSASTYAATVLEWDISAGAGGVLCKVLTCGVMAVCVEKIACFACVCPFETGKG